MDYDEIFKQLQKQLDVYMFVSLLKIADADDEAVRFFTTLIDKGCPVKAITDTLLEFGKEIKDEDRNNRENDDN